MTHWKTQFNYPYLGAHSLPEGKDLILTIREMKREEVTGENGKKDMCLIAYFHENVKPMVVNKTNCKTLEKLFKTPDIEQWINKAMQVGSARVNVKGEMIDALRVRPFAPKLGDDRSTVETGSAIWNNIIDGLKGGYTVNQVIAKYKLTKEQIKELQKHEIR